MRKNLFLFAVAALAMTACSNDDFVGDKSAETKGAPIQFSGEKPNFTRADDVKEGDAAATLLNNEFNVYGVKDVDDATTVNVFAANDYDAAANTPYWLWYDNTQIDNTTTNKKGWEYVGDYAGQHQDIKFWDYAAPQYRFVAYANKLGENGAKITNLNTEGFEVEGTPEQMAALYIADYKTVLKANYNEVVTFTFRSSASKVRFGIYETVPGYVVKDITFRYTNEEGAQSSGTNAILDGSFIGSLAGASKAKVTFDAENKAVLTADVANKTTFFDFGTFNSSAAAGIGVTADAPTWAGGTTDGYQNVAANTTNVGSMTLYVNYTLYHETTGETINVTGAKAVVPATYMAWQPNYAYTYLFKITDNTNGTTGEEGKDPAGIYPIVFDAVVSETVVAEQQGTITTVTTPCITTYQNGSVSDAGISYVGGAESIYFTVSKDGALCSLDATTTKLYTVAAGTTEADMMANAAKCQKEEANTSLEFPAAGETVQDITFAAGQYAKINNPASDKTYAIEYLNGNDKSYKIVIVK